MFLSAVWTLILTAVRKSVLMKKQILPSLMVHILQIFILDKLKLSLNSVLFSVLMIILPFLQYVNILYNSYFKT